MVVLTNLFISPELILVNNGLFQYSLPPSPVYPITWLPANAASTGGNPNPSKYENDKKILDLFINVINSLFDKLCKFCKVHFFGK